MSEADSLIAPSNSSAEVEALANRAEAELVAAEADDASATMHRWQAGQYLLRCKATILHDGQWGKFQRDRFPNYSPRRLQEFMDVAESVPEEEARNSALSGFGINGLLLKIRAERRANKRKHPTSSSGGGGEPEIIHGNCLDILPTITEPHFLISDPPYNQGYHYNGYSDALPPEEYRDLLLTVFRDKPSVIILYPEDTINLLGGGQLGECQKVVSWVYPSNTGRQHRLVTWWNCKPDLSRLGQPYKNPNDRRIAARIRMGDEAGLYDWWEINQVKNVSKDHEHPCPIPEELARLIILTTTREGHLIVDPFCGSGTILKVAKEHKRRVLGIEICEEYANSAGKRIAETAEAAE